jgi:hypothetical protein
MPNLYKKLLKIISVILLFFVLSSTAQAQHWCLPGSTWYYEAEFFGRNGYQKYTYVGDTLVNNINCKKISTYFKEYRWATSGEIHEYFGQPYYTYEQNGVTYLYNNFFGENKFDTLFNFNSQIGDKWRVALVDTACADSLYYMTVLDTGSQVINGISLKWLQVNNGLMYHGSGNYGYTTFKIFERLGYKFDEGEYFNCYGEGIAEYQHTTFRCYSDSTFGLYSTDINISCDYIDTDIAESKPNSINLSLFPNPATDELNISFDGFTPIDGRIEITDMIGKLIHQKSIKSGGVYNYSTLELPRSIYMVSLYVGNKLVENKKLVLIN